jgi:hypothetical protein
MHHIVQFHENPTAIAWWQARFGAALRWETPARRRALLGIGACVAGVVIPAGILAENRVLAWQTDAAAILAIVALLFGFLWLVHRAAAGFSSLPSRARRHPQWALHLLYWGLLAALWGTASASGPWRTVLFGVAVVLPFLLWRCGYLLLAGQHGRVAGSPFREHLLYLWPAWGGNNTPYGKGLDYLTRCEAKSEEELARSQLSGIRLALLAALWGVTLYAFEAFLYGPGNALTARLGGYTLGIPALNDLVKEGGAAPQGAAWASLYCELFKQVLRHAAGSHGIIAVLRLFGFNVFRSTYKPLLAESIVEFWNRFYYYFKELLVTFFFLPTFAGFGRKLRRWPQLRLFVAVFAAACLGNLYYHLLRMAVPLAQGEVVESLLELRPRVVYCVLLAIGIFVSMLREQRRQGGAPLPGGPRRLLRIFGVWTFFAVIWIWGVRGGASLPSRTEFFLGLFGLA